MGMVAGDMINYETNVENANMVRDLVVRTLYNEGKLSEEDFKEYTDKYAVVLVREKWYKRMFGVAKSLTQKADEKRMVYKFVKID